MAIIRETADAANLSGTANPVPQYILSLGDTFIGRLDAGSSDVDYFGMRVEPGWSYVVQLRQTEPETGFGFRYENLTRAQVIAGEVGFTGVSVLNNVPNADVFNVSASDGTLVFSDVRWNGYSGEYTATLEREVSGDFDTVARVAVGGTFRSTLGIENAAGGSNGDIDLIGVVLEAGTDYTVSVTLEDSASPAAFQSVQTGREGRFNDDLIFLQNGVGELDISADVDGLYFIRISQSSGAVVDYTLSVTEPQGVDITDDDVGRTLTGTAAADRIDGRGGNDTIDGLSGNDTLFGGDGDDTITGGDGDDTINGNAGADRMLGGEGSDTYVIDNSRDVIVDVGREGIDVALTSIDYALSGSDVERLQAAGRANLRLDGNRNDQELVGNAGNNILVGFGGEDTMTGGGGRDVFALNSTGNPLLDTFEFSPLRLTITDFTRGQDRLAIDDQLLGIGDRGIDVRELTGAVFRDIRDSGTVGYNARTGELRLDVDGDGNRELVAVLEGGTALGFDDVLLF